MVSCFLSVSETVHPSADAEWIHLVSYAFAAQPGGVEPLLRHVQLRGAPLAPLRGQLGGPGASKRAEPRSGRPGPGAAPAAPTLPAL